VRTTAAAPTARTTEAAPIARTTEAAPIATRAATPSASTPALDLVPVATFIEPASPPAIPHSGPPRRTVNREVRVGDIVVELGEPLPRPAAEHAGTLTAAIPRRNLETRRRL
jgi:hypothetical protein